MGEKFDFDWLVDVHVDRMVDYIKYGISPKKQIWHIVGDLIYQYDFYKKVCFECPHYEGNGNCLLIENCDSTEGIFCGDFYLNVALARKMSGLGYVAKVVYYSLEEED